MNVLITDFYCMQLTVFHNQHLTKDSTIMSVKSTEIKQKITLPRETIKYSQLSGSSFFLQMLSWYLLCDILYPSYVFQLIYILAVSIGGYIFSKWLQKAGDPRRIFFFKVLHGFKVGIFKYNIKRFISCKQKCKIYSHKNILLVIVHNSEWG